MTPYNSPTPLTYAAQYKDEWCMDVVPADFAKSLERRLAAMREAAVSAIYQT